MTARKSFRLLAVVLGIGLLSAALFWMRPSAGFVTPTSCVEAYYQAASAGDWPGVLRSLSDSGRNEAKSTALKRVQDIKNWVQVGDPSIDGSTAQVNIDEQRVEGRQRVRYRLENTGRGWVITEIGAPQDLPQETPYGTHVKGP